MIELRMPERCHESTNHDRENVVDEQQWARFSAECVRLARAWQIREGVQAQTQGTFDHDPNNRIAAVKAQFFQRIFPVLFDEGHNQSIRKRAVDVSHVGEIEHDFRICIKNGSICSKR
jgi:hypothetical protein